MGRQGWGARQPASQQQPLPLPLQPRRQPLPLPCPALSHLQISCLPTLRCWPRQSCLPKSGAPTLAPPRQVLQVAWWQGGAAVLLSCWCCPKAPPPPPPPRPVAAPGSRRRLRVNQPLPSLGGGPFLRGCVLCCCRWRCCRLTPRPSWQRRCRSWWRGSRWVGGQVAGWRAGWGCWGE